MRVWLAAIAALVIGATAHAQDGAAPAKTEAQAWAQVHKLLPRNTAMDKIDGQWFVTPPNEAPRAATPPEVAAINELAAAILAQRHSDRWALRSTLTAEERAAVDAASEAIRAVLPAGAWHTQTSHSDVIVTLLDNTQRPPLATEQPALDRFYALADQIELRLRRDDMAKAPLLILADDSLIGAERTAVPGEPLWTQPLVFRRNAALASDMIVQRGRATTTVPAGAALFIVPGPKGRDAYCWPRESEKNLLPGAADWLPCFVDGNDDGALDKQTNGGKPDAGVFLGARGFRSAGVVVSSARTRDIPSAEGFRQRIGPRWSYSSTNKQTGEAVAYFELVVAPAEGRGAPISGASFAVPLDASGSGEGEILGARFALEQRGGKAVKIRLLKPMPEQAFGVRPVGEQSYSYEPRYVPR